MITRFLSNTWIGAGCLAAVLVASRSGSPPNSMPRFAPAITDNDIRTMVKEIDPKRIETAIRKLVSFGTRSTLSKQDDPFRGIGAARDWLFAQYQEIAKTSNGRMTVELQSFEQARGARIPQPTKLTNVVATLKGMLPAEQERVYIVSGHYDSMPSSPTDGTTDAPGANDDASGTVVALECARVMATRQFKGTIIFMAVAGEEQGLLGSTYFAEQAKQKTMPIDAMFTNDIVGNTEGMDGKVERGYLRLFSEGVPATETEAEARTRRSVGGEVDSSSRQLARLIKETGEKFVKGFKVRLVYRRDRYRRGGDHIPFNERGFTAVRFTEAVENYTRQHQNPRTADGIAYGDVPDKVDFAYVANVARVNLAALAEMAGAPAAPKNLRLRQNQSPDTNLTWQAVDDPDLDHYEIVWRDTTEPTWSHAKSTAKETTITLKGYSKDDWFFGVRSVGKDGRKSLVRYPGAGRNTP